MSRYDVLIVGGGHAGAQTAIALRQAGYEGSIAIVGDESDPPYERPPLSKEYFTGEKDLDRLLIRPLSFWREREVELLLGRRVVRVDPETSTVELSNGDALGWTRLVWAAGCAPRRLDCDGANLDGVHVLRERADADAILAHLPRVRQAVVVGGGYIGLEAASALTKAGVAVTVLEAQDRVLARVAGEPLSRFYEQRHRDHGVDVRLNASVAAIVGKDGQVSGVRTADGASLPAQLVLVGIGVIPAVEPLRAAGVKGDNGVDVDAFCRTSLADIYAVGDCAAHINRFADGRRIRLESVQNAVDQAAVVARHIMGAAQAYDAVPWFWSNQYDLRLQTVGLHQGHDRIVLRGDPDAGAFSLIYLAGERLLAVDCVNAPKDYMQGRKLVASPDRFDAERLADPAVSLPDARRF